MSAKGKVLLGLGAVGGAAALAGLRGMGASRRNQLQTLDLMNQRKQDMSTPMPDFTAVKKAYEQFAAQKAAADYGSFGEAVTSGAMQGVGRGVGDAIGDILVRKPIDVIGSMLKKQFVTHPRQQRVFDQVLQGDESLSREHASNPNMLSEAHGTLKRFAPSLSEDPNAVRAYLRHAIMTGGSIDPSTIKSLADAELTFQRSRGKVK